MTESVQSVNLERALEIEASSVVDAQRSGDNVILTTAGGTVFNAGNISAVDPSTADILPAAVVTIDQFDADAYDVVIPEFYDPKVPNLLLTDIPNRPGSVPYALSWTSDSKYLAILLTNTSPYLMILRRSGESFFLISYPSPAVSTGGEAVSWSPDGQYLAVSQYSAPWMYIYKRSGDDLFRLNLSLLLPGNVRSISWTADGQYLATAHAGSPHFSVHKRTGDSFARLANPTIFPSQAGEAISWTPDGRYLALGHNGAPGLIIYEKEGEVLTKIEDPIAISSGTGISVNWSPDGQYLAKSESPSNICIYKRSGDVVTQLPNAIDATGGSNHTVEWSPDGNYLAVSNNSGPGVSAILLYKRIDETFILVPNFPNEGGPDNAIGLAWSPDGSYLAVGYITSPYLDIQRSSMQIPPGNPKRILPLP